ncbi:MAG TPA: M56 family metallopeptidase, partial [Thermoanaerobaculia bacterium]|nr:M56 family metallopeptidase [Thermoanaerobaculia bacterium]
MTTMQILTGPLAQAIGWALLHLLWQATIVAAILAAALALIPRRSASARYAAACGALGLVFLMFVATAWRAYDPAVAPVSSTPADLAAAKETIKITLNQVPVVLATMAAETWRDRLVEMVTSARQALPAIVAIWLTGVLLLSSRLMVSWTRARRLVHHDSIEASHDWQRVAARLSDALGLRKAVRLLESAAVEVPSVIGSLRPVILLPASTLTGLTPQQIEMVLAHELAHIRRHDFLVNLLQAVVETLMFYHPAVWWMSRRVREERENCCDDLAVAVCGNPIQYARALTRLEELRSAPSLLVAANGGSLLDRIRRIAGGRAESTAVSARWAAAMITLVVLAAGVGIPSLPAFAQRDARSAEPPAPPAPMTNLTVVAPVEPAEPGQPVTPAEPGDELDIDDEVDVDFDFDVDVEPPDPPDHPDFPIIATHIDPSPAIAAAIADGVAGGVPGALAALGAADAMNAGDEEKWARKGKDKDKDKHARSDRQIGVGGPLTIDELINLRAVGVTPEYIDSMRTLFPNLTIRQVSNLKALGVTGAFVQEMRDAGLTIDSASTASNLKAVGVTGEYIRELRAAGVKIDSAKQASSMKAVGVTVTFVKQL